MDTFTLKDKVTYRVLVGRPDGKRTLEKPGRRWGNNIKIYHQEVGLGSMDWFAVAEEGAGGGRWNGIKDDIHKVPRNVGYQSSDDTSQHFRRTKNLNNSNAISGSSQFRAQFRKLRLLESS
jgi:hypothetical protein